MPNLAVNGNRDEFDILILVIRQDLSPNILTHDKLLFEQCFK